MTVEHEDEVRVQRHRNSPECDVIVTYRGREMSLRCRDYDQAIKWARIECKAYKLTEAFVGERIGQRWRQRYISDRKKIAEGLGVVSF